MGRKMSAETNDRRDLTLETTSDSPQRVSDRLPVLIPWTTVDVHSPCYVDCSPPVLSPMEVTDVEGSSYTQYSGNVGDGIDVTQNEINKKENSSIQDISFISNTYQNLCETISDLPLDYSMKIKNEEQTLNAEERKENTEIIENSCEPIATASVNKRETFLISDIVGPQVDTTKLGLTGRKRENLEQSGRLIVGIHQSESETKSEIENSEQSERTMVNTNQPEDRTLRKIGNSEQSEITLANMNQSEGEMMNEDQSRRSYFLSHSCDERAVSETLLMLSGVSYDRDEGSSVHISMCHDKSAASTDSWDSVSTVYSDPLPLSSESLKYVRSISVDGRYESKDACHSCPVESNWSSLESKYSDAEERYSFSRSGLFEVGDQSMASDSARECVNGNNFILSHSSYFLENVCDPDSNSEILQSYLKSELSSGDSLKETLPKCPPRNGQPTEISISSDHAHENKLFQFCNETNHNIYDEEGITRDWELNALRRKLQLLLYVVLGQERLTRLGHPETDIDNILNIVLSLAHVTPCQPREKSEVLACLRVNIKELLLLCVPQETLWNQYGWKNLTVDEIMESLYCDEVLPYLQEVKRNRLKDNGEGSSSLMPNRIEVEIDCNRHGQIDSGSQWQSDNGSDELTTSNSSGHTDVGTDVGTDGEMCKQVNSISEVNNVYRAVKIKKGRGRPRKRKTNGNSEEYVLKEPGQRWKTLDINMLKRKRFFLWRFLLELLLNPQNSGDIKWLRKEEGIFQIVNSRNIARQWGRHQGNPNMNYEKMARAMRTYYVTKVLSPVPKESVYPKKLVYKFSTGIMKLLDDGNK